MGLLWALIVGLIVGALAKLVMPGRDPGGIIVTMLLGIAGSFVALLVGRALGLYDMRDDGPGIIASVLGAVLLLAGYRAIAGRRRLY
ncbi:MAG: GlsB/YeaQ/YmgE family stress response membrane protein [Polyangiales bacterium]